MKVGDKVYAVLSLSRGYDVELVQIIGEKTIVSNEVETSYFEIRYIESYGVSGMPKGRVFKTKEEAMKYRKKLFKEDHEKFAKNLKSKKSFFEYLYDNAVIDEKNEANRELIANKIEEYTGIDVLMSN